LTDSIREKTALTPAKFIFDEKSARNSNLPLLLDFNYDVLIIDRPPTQTPAPFSDLLEPTYIIESKSPKINQPKDLDPKADPNTDADPKADPNTDADPKADPQQADPKKIYLDLSPTPVPAPAPAPPFPQPHYIQATKLPTLLTLKTTLHKSALSTPFKDLKSISQLLRIIDNCLQLFLWLVLLPIDGEGYSYMRVMLWPIPGFYL
jgi:hypothetical protein